MAFALSPLHTTSEGRRFANNPSQRVSRRRADCFRQRAPSCVLQAKTLAEASLLIHSQESTDGAVVARGALQPITWLERLTLPRALDVGDIRIEVDVRSSIARLSNDMKPAIPRCAVDALRSLAVAHATASEPRETVLTVRGRVALVEGVPCRRLHMDKVNLRTLATLSGRGCVIAPRADVDVHMLLSERARDPSLTNAEHDELVLVDAARASLDELASGDVAFLAGAGPRNECIHSAAVHRSPRTIEKRLIVQIDDWTEAP
jgi:Protein of unknown function (DUF1826)